MWEEGFRRLLHYVEGHSDARVPQRYTVDGYNLGRFVSKQRTRHSKGTLDADRRRQLENLPGWAWDPFADMWEEGFLQLLGYVESNGDARVPARHTVDGYRLGQWVDHQRRNHTKGTLEADRERRLEDLPGWAWDPFADMWEEGFRQLLGYVESNGDARVPRK